MLRWSPLAATISSLVWLVAVAPRHTMPVHRRAEAVPALGQVAVNAPGRIVVGPNIQVDLDANTAYVEPHIAADPRNATDVLGASMMFAAGNLTTQVFQSHDGGFTWSPAGIPGYVSGPGDVQLAFASGGAAYFAELGSNPEIKVDANHSGHGLYVFRSEDGGRMWPQMTFLQYHRAGGALGSYDHEQILVDNGAQSRFRGHVYMTVLYSLRESPQLNQIGLLASADGGKTFSGPAPIATGWFFNSAPIAFSDGQVFVPFIDTRQAMTKHYSDIDFAISNDGGRSVSKMHTIARWQQWPDMIQRMHAGYTAMDGDPVPQYAVDATNGRFKDRLYLVWSDERLPQSHVLFMYSSNRGSTWSKPEIIAADRPLRGSQYQTSIAVNKDGAVGIRWFDTRDDGNSQYNEYFTASLDGGKTFLRPVRVSSASSIPRNAGNGVYYGVGSEFFYQKLWTFMVSPVGRYPSGGDYMGMTTDASGAFHPIWIDARSGPDQVFTATIRVMRPGQRLASIPPLAKRDLSRMVYLTPDAGSWDAATHTLSIPLRIRNISSQNLYGPFTVTVTATEEKSPDIKNAPGFGLVGVLNPDNGKQGVGAVYRYTLNPNGLPYIPPNGVSDPRIWKLRLPAFASQPSFGTQITGYVTR